jgi:hypothetical protein
MGWSQHKEAKICIPPQEISNGDCGEGELYHPFLAQWF